MVPYLRTSHSRLQRWHWSSHICPSFTGCVAQPSHWHQLAFSPTGIFCLLPHEYNWKKSHLFPLPSESPWRIFPSLSVSLGWFALWQISETLHFLALVFPAPAWKTHKQKTDYFIVPPSRGQRAAPSCGVTSWQSQFYIMLRYQAKVLHYRASCVFSFATEQTLLVKGKQPRATATSPRPPLCKTLWCLTSNSMCIFLIWR